MLGRVVFALCSLTGAALACPPRPASPDEQGVAVAFGLMTFCIVGYVLARGNAIRRTFATSRQLADGDLEVLRRVARIQRRRAICGVALCALVLMTPSIAVNPDHIAFVVSPPLVLLIISVVTLCRLQVLIGLRAEPGLRVLSHGHYLYVVRGNRLVDFVAASPSLLARATSLPTAKVL
jgi:hypothetical protein